MILAVAALSFMKISNKLSSARVNTNMGTREGREGDSGDGMDFQDAFVSVCIF